MQAHLDSEDLHSHAESVTAEAFCLPRPELGES
jgi:hypothetical protein